MLRLSIIFGLLASIIWRTTPTSCREPNKHPHNVNQIMTFNIESFMDTTARPCENFYQFACGNWYQHHIDQLEFGDMLGLLDYELNTKLEHLLKKNAALNWTNTFGDGDDSNDLSSLYDKVYTYYKSCKKVKPYNLKKYLQLIQPGFEASWFALSRNGGKGWHANKFDWLLAIGKLRLYGLNGVLLKEEVLPRWDESDIYSIYLDKPNLADTEPMDEGVMIELMLDIGQTKRVSNAIAREVALFELQLHKLHEIEDEEGAKEMQLSFLQDFMPQIDWLNYLKQLKGPATNTETTVIIQNIPYMRALVKLLSNVTRETQSNYIMLKFLHFLKRQGPGIISKQECIGSLRRAMPLAMSYITGAHFYKDPVRNDNIVQRMFAAIIKKFEEIIKGNRLKLDPLVIETLVEKIQRMRLQVGNSPRNASADFYNEFYDRVELDPNNFYVNQLSLLRLAVEKSHEKLESQELLNLTAADNSSYVLSEWLGSSSSPFYVKPKNLLIVPYGFLQLPIYHWHLKDVFKYSVLGFALAHEILHGFDSTGIDYDSGGNIMGPSEVIAANKQFMQGLRCMQNELATGSRSLNEKLADYQGIRLSYETYFTGNITRLSSTRPQILPQLTEKQLFFVSFAQFFCGKVHSNVRQSSYLEHAQDELRVLQTLANYEEFTKEFQCESHSKMNSKSRCKLW